MSEPGAAENGAAFSVQLREAHVYEIAVARRARTDSDDAGPTLDAGPRAFSHDEVNHRLIVLVGGQVNFPFGDDLAAVAEVTCSVLGAFSYAGQPSEELLKVFPGREGLVILWPYLRAGVAQIAGMTGLQLPPLPTLDVLATLGGEAEKALSAQP